MSNVRNKSQITLVAVQRGEIPNSKYKSFSRNMAEKGKGGGSYNKENLCVFKLALTGHLLCAKCFIYLMLFNPFKNYVKIPTVHTFLEKKFPRLHRSGFKTKVFG